MTLDGNAAAGILRQVFAVEMTEALGTCAGCGAVEAVGAVVVYERAPGMVLRCPHCEADTPDGAKFCIAAALATLDLRGVRSLEVRV